MPNALQQAGATSEPSNFAPLHTNRIFTGLWTNRSPLRDAATSVYEEKYGMGRQDSILTGYNSEISTRLTLRRRWGHSVYNATSLPPVKRFYSFNTFTITDETIRVMADTAATVYDITGGGAAAVFTKSSGAGSTYFLGVGNTLYMTNGVDNVQWNYDPTTGTGTISKWGIDAPTNAPSVSLPIFTGYGSWLANTVFSRTNQYAKVLIIDTNGNIQNATAFGVTGIGNPVWATIKYHGTTDGTVGWENLASGLWTAGQTRAYNDLIYRTSSDGNQYFYQAQNNGTCAAIEPTWLPGLNSLTQDNDIQWLNLGRTMTRTEIGDSTNVITTDTILDPSGGVQACQQSGKSGGTAPTFSAVKSALTSDPSGNPLGAILWQNAGAVGPVQYGYAFMNSKTTDISNMSPASLPISINDGHAVVVQGTGSTDSQVDTIVIFRTTHGGSTFLYLDQIPNPAGGGAWSYTDTKTDAQLNTEWQAQRTGEGTPLPAGATALGYHIGRIFAAVGNVVWISSGPDALVAGSSGNAGFDIQLTAQSKITRFWACSLGMVVFTVRDAYIILGSGTDTDPLYMVVFIEELPLRSYDCFTVNKTTPYLLMGNNQLVALDPSAGIMEAGFPIADRFIDEYNTAQSYVTFHSQSTLDTALYVANGGVDINGNPTTGQWYRMAANNAPEQGSAWSTKATLAGFNMGCVQSVEVTPGQFRLLISGTTAGPILQRDRTMRTDNSNAFTVRTVFGQIILALPGQLACLSFITLESVRLGTRAGLALLLGEISGTFDDLKRTRQDPPNLPQSETIYSDRYHFAQNQNEAWCRHFQLEITWPAEDAANELLTYTIFGQTWQEMRSQ